MVRIEVLGKAGDTIHIGMVDGKRGIEIFFNRNGSNLAKYYGHANIYKIAYCVRVL